MSISKVKAAVLTQFEYFLPEQSDRTVLANRLGCRKWQEGHLTRDR
ncbi:hypothetical protein [Myxacorys almedinensis]|uniref:Uncharacterized protein n=1 Tax=Myxacorys almedinensis A TaxID=2690445 RepID=A0A8J7YXE3_9CYAN|nr:hypothetical protein [Myxacorys almedinensis]NDJ16349.1 hypothetical protein [Myxacorys almedinensis A]